MYEEQEYIIPMPRLKKKLKIGVTMSNNLYIWYKCEFCGKIYRVNEDEALEQFQRVFEDPQEKAMEYFEDKQSIHQCTSGQQGISNFVGTTFHFHLYHQHSSKRNHL